MVPITNKANSQEQVNVVGNFGPNTTNIGVNQQVNINNNISTYFDDGAHFTANAIQTSSMGELTNYHYQSLGLPNT